MTRLALIVLAFLAVAIVAARCDPPARAQPGAPLAGTPVAIGFEATRGVILDGIRAPMLPGGGVGRWEPWAYIGIEGGAAVWTVAEPGYMHFVSCGLQRPGEEYTPSEVYLPVTVRGFRRWEWWLLR